MISCSMKTKSIIGIFLAVCSIPLACITWESCRSNEEEEPTEEEQYLQMLGLITSDEASRYILNKGYELEGTFIENQEASYAAGETVYDAGAIWYNTGCDSLFIVAAINNYASTDEALAALNGEGNLESDAIQSLGEAARQGTVDYKGNRVANALAFVRNTCYVFIASCSSDTLAPALDFDELYNMAATIDDRLIDLGPLKYLAGNGGNMPPEKIETPAAPDENLKSVLKHRMYHMTLFNGTQAIGYADVRFTAYLNIDGTCNSSCDDGYCHAVDFTGELVRFHLNWGASDGDPFAGDGDILLKGNMGFTYECSTQNEIYRNISIDSEIGDITQGETLAGDASNTAEPKGTWPVVFVKYEGCQCPSVENIILRYINIQFHDNDSGGAIEIISEIVETFMEYNDRFKFVKFSNATSFKIHLTYAALKLIAKYIVVPIWDEVNFVGGVSHTFNADEEKLPWSL
jgi:hypothetical protein